MVQVRRSRRDRLRLGLARRIAGRAGEVRARPDNAQAPGAPTPPDMGLGHPEGLDVVAEPDPPADPDRRRWELWVLFALVVLAAAVWMIWALWVNQPTAAHAAPTDRWLDVMTGIGATTAAVGVVVGGTWALLYGRKASVSVSAEAHPLPDGGVILTARPLVRAVGLFRVKFYGGAAAATVDVRELRLDDDAESGTQLSIEKWTEVAAFGEQHADGGEEVPTTVVFRLRKPADNVVGWMVWLDVQASRRWVHVVPNATGSWADRIFIPRPAKLSAPVGDYHGVEPGG